MISKMNKREGLPTMQFNAVSPPKKPENVGYSGRRGKSRWNPSTGPKAGRR